METEQEFLAEHKILNDQLKLATKDKDGKRFIEVLDEMLDREFVTTKWHEIQVYNINKVFSLPQEIKDKLKDKFSKRRKLK